MFNIKLLTKIAARSDFKNKHVSLIIKGGALLASAYNHNGVHAEVRALKCLWPNKRRGTTVVNLRLAHSGQIGSSRPCPSCWQAMKQAGVATVFYSVWGGEFEMERI